MRRRRQHSQKQKQCRLEQIRDNRLFTFVIDNNIFNSSYSFSLFVTWRA
jgi:hypothetical protein